MKIELIYDPVRPETDVRIDGKLVDRGDIYGFLYPVRSCLLQSWLEYSGSWKGLDRQLQELRRGEKLEVVFSGRPVDFADVQLALEGAEGIALSFRERDLVTDYRPLLSRLEEAICRILDEGQDTGEKKTFAQLLPQEAAAIQAIREESVPSWRRYIAQEEDFALAQGEEGTCCLVEEEYLDSYEKLDKLRLLTRSMRRSQDMICCMVRDPQKRSDFCYYAAQNPGMAFRFQEEEAFLTSAKRKYGLPASIRARIGQYGRMLDIFRSCYDRRSQVESRRTELGKLKDKSPPQLRELDQCRTLLNWMDRKQPYIQHLVRLVKEGPAALEEEE